MLSNFFDFPWQVIHVQRCVCLAHGSIVSSSGGTAFTYAFSDASVRQLITHHLTSHPISSHGLQGSLRLPHPTIAIQPSTGSLRIHLIHMTKHPKPIIVLHQPLQVLLLRRERPHQTLSWSRVMRWMLFRSVAFVYRVIYEAGGGLGCACSCCSYVRCS